MNTSNREFTFALLLSWFSLAVAPIPAVLAESSCSSVTAARL